MDPDYEQKQIDGQELQTRTVGTPECVVFSSRNYCDSDSIACAFNVFGY
jgi:hypothetical protein